MKVTQEKLPASQMGLEIEIPPQQSKQAYEKIIRDLSRSANIPGFRKGKVPRHILLQQYGPQRIKAAAVEELIQDGIQEALEQEKIPAIGNFQLRSTFEDLVNQFKPGEGLTFSAAVDVQPEVNLTQYRDLRIQAEAVQYNPEQVDRVLDDYRGQLATLVPVEERPAQAGDVVVIDYDGYLAGQEDSEKTDPAERQAIPGGQAQDFQLELSEDRFLAGFVSGIIGMEPGETREITTQFPEDYPQTDLAGQPATFSVTLKEIKLKELPELDDDFAQEISDFDTLAELRESLEQRYQKEAEQKTKANKEQSLLDALLESLEVELPETLIRQEVDYLISRSAMQLESQGMDIKQLLTQENIPKLREQVRPEAITRLQQTLALGEVAKREGIKADQAAVETRVKELLQQYSDEKLDPERLRENVEDSLLREKVFEWLEANSTIELVPEGTLTQNGEAADAEEQLTTPSDETVETASVEVASEAGATDTRDLELAPEEEAP